MSAIFNLNYPLISICWPRQNKLVKNLALVLTGVLVLAIASQLSIPLHPVPLTFQSATVILIGMIYGARLGGITIATYLLAGTCGLPVFAEMYSGIATLLFDPTSGYLWAFLPAAVLSGYLAQRGWGKQVISAFAACLLGAVVIFSIGIAVLSHYTGLNQAYTIGLKPFLLTELIKLAVVAMIAPRFWRTQADRN